MDSTPNGTEPWMGLNSEWTQSRMDPTLNGPQPRMGLNLEWTQPRLGLNLEWTQPQMGFTPNETQPRMDLTPNGTQPRMDSTPKWDSTRNGLNIMLSCIGFFFIFSIITRGLVWYMLFTMASHSKLNIAMWYMNMTMNGISSKPLKRDNFNCCSKEHFFSF
jgi:hypothetical protein